MTKNKKKSKDQEEKYKAIDTVPDNWKSNATQCPWGSLVKIIKKPDKQSIRVTANEEEEIGKILADEFFKPGDVEFVVKSFEHKNNPNEVLLVFAQGPSRSFVYYTENFRDDFQVVRKGSTKLKEEESVKGKASKGIVNC